MRRELMRDRLRSRRGTALMEFALAGPVLLFVTAGALAGGLHLDRYLTMKQLARSASHMYTRGADFSKPEVQELLLKVAAGLKMTADGGPAVVYLSIVVKADSGANAGRPVVFHRVRLGNPSLISSKIAMPENIAPTGHVYDSDNDSSALATLPAALIMDGIDRVCVAEVFHTPGDLSLPQLFSVGRMYTAAFF